MKHSHTLIGASKANSKTNKREIYEPNMLLVIAYLYSGNTIPSLIRS